MYIFFSLLHQGTLVIYSKAYNVHRHSSEFDDGVIEAVGNHSHAGAQDASGNFEPGENLAYGCFAPFEKRNEDPRTWALYQAAHPSGT